MCYTSGTSEVHKSVNQCVTLVVLARFSDQCVTLVVLARFSNLCVTLVEQERLSNQRVTLVAPAKFSNLCATFVALTRSRMCTPMLSTQCPRFTFPCISKPGLFATRLARELSPLRLTDGIDVCDFRGDEQWRAGSRSLQHVLPWHVYTES